MSVYIVASYGSKACSVIADQLSFLGIRDIDPDGMNK